MKPTVETVKLTVIRGRIESMSEHASFSIGGYIPSDPQPWHLVRRGNLHSETGEDGTWFRIFSAEEVRALGVGPSKGEQ